MTEDDIRARLTQEVERLLAENARLQEEKRRDVGVWLRAERDYRDKNDRLTARVKELEAEVAWHKNHSARRGETDAAVLRRVKELEEALRKIDIGFVRAKDAMAMHDEAVRIARAALTPAPEKEPTND